MIQISPEYAEKVARLCGYDIDSDGDGVRSECGNWWSEDWVNAYACIMERAPYPFCRHPWKCTDGRCMAEFCCND